MEIVVAFFTGGVCRQLHDAAGLGIPQFRLLAGHTRKVQLATIGALPGMTQEVNIRPIEHVMNIFDVGIIRKIGCNAKRRKRASRASCLGIRDALPTQSRSASGE